MLRNLFPPICLLVAIAMAVVSFSMMAFGGPEASVALHQARASGDELSTTTLEEDLKERQRKRVVIISSLFVGSGIMTVVAFSSIGSAAGKRKT